MTKKLKSICLEYKNGNILSVWWFAILVIVGSGVVLSTALFYSSYVDVKAIESEILANRIYDCINSYNFNNIHSLDDFDIFKECRINKDLFAEGSNYFIRFFIKDKETGEIIIGKEHKFGNYALEKDCDIQKKVLANKHFPYCTNKILEATTKDGKSILVEILAASNNEGGVPNDK
ncbi:hypothetical protein HYW74_04885 [Candidatus Pacearchaeota archaeon]|nr:hypothetical protein [Candidatus Pacearchaeota archaeon]